MDTEQEWRREVVEELKKIREELQDCLTGLRVTQNDLKHYLKTTDDLEENIKTIAADLVPIKRHVSMVEGAIKVFSVISVICAAILGIIKLFGK